MLQHPRFLFFVLLTMDTVVHMIVADVEDVSIIVMVSVVPVVLVPPMQVEQNLIFLK